MRTIWKFAIEPDMEVALPAEARVLTVQMQGETPQMWVLLDPARPTIPRRFCVVGTGRPIPDARLSYCGTFQLHGGTLVFHVFEREE